MNNTNLFEDFNYSTSNWPWIFRFTAKCIVYPIFIALYFIYYVMGFWILFILFGALFRD